MLQTKLVTNNNTENKLDQIIFKALHENETANAIKETRFVNLNSNNKLETNDDTPVTIASVYHPKKTKKILAENLLVLLDCGSSHSMAKSSIVKQYKNTFFRKEKSSYKTADGCFNSRYSMKIHFTLDEFGKATIISHRFDLDESKDGIGYDMIIGRDLLRQLNIDVRFSNGTIKWEDQLVRMKSFSYIWEHKYPSRKEIKATVLRSIQPRSTKEATTRALKILNSGY